MILENLASVLLVHERIFALYMLIVCEIFRLNSKERTGSFKTRCFLLKTSQDKLCLDFLFLHNYPKLYSKTMQQLQRLTEKNVYCEHIVLSNIPDVLQIIILILFSDII